MNVLHVITDLDVGGAEMMLLKIVSEHQKLGVKSRVVNLSGPGAISAEIRKAGIPVLDLQIKSPLKFLSGLPEFLAWSFWSDLIQGWMYHGNLAALIFSSYRPVVWNIRQSLSQFHSEKKSLQSVIQWNQRLSKMAKSIIYNSQLARNQHEEFGFSASSGLVLGNGFETEKFQANSSARSALRKSWDLNEEHFVISHVGRFHRDKDHRTFILAGIEFLKGFPEARFALAGRGVDASNSEIASWIPSDQKEKFILLGEYKDVPALLSASDVYTSSSIAEAFSNSIGEAMACGLPCVVTRVGDSELILGDRHWVIEPGETDRLVEKWKELKSLQPEQRQALGSQFRQRLVENYSLTKIAEQYKDLYSRLVK